MIKVFNYSYSSSRDNLAKQLDITHVKLKTESLNFNFLQEQCAELEQEKKMMEIEMDARQKDHNTRYSLFDSEINTVSFYRYNSDKIYFSFLVP